MGGRSFNGSEQTLVGTFLSGIYCTLLQREAIFGDIGFIAGDTLAAHHTLEGTYVYPPDTDPATKFLPEEASRTYNVMAGAGIATYIMVADFQYYWQPANTRICISSSYSGLHMSRYKATSFDKYLSALHASKLSLAAKMGVSLARWSMDITILL